MLDFEAVFKFKTFSTSRVQSFPLLAPIALTNLGSSSLDTTEYLDFGHGLKIGWQWGDLQATPQRANFASYGPWSKLLIRGLFRDYMGSPLTGD